MTSGMENNGYAQAAHAGEHADLFEEQQRRISFAKTAHANGTADFLALDDIDAVERVRRERFEAADHIAAPELRSYPRILHIVNQL